MQTLLFIENYEIELDDSVQFALNKQFEELSNPTIIINDWSKTVSIPFTAHNNKVFGYIYKPERLIVSTNDPDSYKSMGIFFDPTKKLDFRLVYNSMTLMTGYAKMNEIKQTKGKGTYEITLYGLLGKLFQEMKKITFDLKSPDNEYIIDGSMYVNEQYSKDLIKSSWTTEQQTTTLYPRKLLTQGGEVNHPAYKVTDIIGFAPNNSFDEGFDYTAYQTLDGGSIVAKKFTDALSTFQDNTGISPDNVIPKGLLPREIGEYRSYLQIPFIYWNKLFQIFKNKAEEITGYTFNLDNTWFVDGNPYWSKLVYILYRKVFDNKRDNLNNTYPLINNIHSIWGGDYYTLEDYGNMTGLRTYNISFNNSDSFEQVQLLNNNVILLSEIDRSGNNVETIFNISLPFKIILLKSYAQEGTRFLYNALLLTIDIIKNGTNTILDTKTICVKSKNYSGSTSGYNIVVQYNENNDLLDNGKRYYLFNINYSTLFNNSNDVKFKISARWADDSPAPFGAHSNPVELYLLDSPLPYISLNITTSTRSNAPFTLNDLWNNDVNLFNEIIRYCKMFRIGISVDDFNKIIYFKPIHKMFENYSIIDWTDKIDKSKDFIIKPITFDNKYILFNSKGTETQISKEYKELYGLEYGSYRLITDYNFNDKSQNLFENCIESITNTDNVLSWPKLNNESKVIYSLPSDIYVYCKNKDKKFVNTFGAFYFHTGIKYFDNYQSLALPRVLITDDTTYMHGYENYFYTLTNEEGKYVVCATYPRLDIVYNDDLCIFTAPKKSYIYNSSRYENKFGIYKNFWDNYINERYSIQNKLLTCYVKLLPSDFINFKFNNFIKIENQLYIVNKIYDYNVTSSATTKVDLVTVSDVDAYNDDSYMERIDALTKDWNGMIYIDGETGPSSLVGTFSTVSPVHIKLGSSTLLNEYTINGVKFTIVDGNKLYAQRVSRYIEEADVDFTLTFANSHTEITAEFERYSVYPYPQLSASKTSIAYNDTFNLYFDYTPTDEVAPTITYTRTPSTSGNPTISTGTPVASEIMYQEGNNEYFLTRWTIPVTCTANSSSSTGTINFKVTDGVGGWYKNLNINVTALIYTLNSAGTARQSEDSVEYHGTTSTRGYLIYSTHPYEATTIPQGVRFYGGSTGDAGTSSITIDWGSGEPNTSKTVVFTNTGGATCSFVCHYVTQ